MDTFGGLDVLVNNAGIMDTMTATADVSDAECERVIRINLTAPFLLTRAALPHLPARGNGAIVNTASEAALRGSVAGTAYTVSKHGVIGLTKSTAVMYRDRGVRVNAVAPRWHPDLHHRHGHVRWRWRLDRGPLPGERGPRPSVPRFRRGERHQRRRAPRRQRLVGRLTQPPMRSLPEGQRHPSRADLHGAHPCQDVGHARSG